MSAPPIQVQATEPAAADAVLHGRPLGTVPSAPAARRSVASWLGLLFVLLFALNTLGGWVRLSGCGVAIPQWPVIDGSLLPPASPAAWAAVRADYDRDQARLAGLVAAHRLTPDSLGRLPRDDADFRSMFLTEWCHRLLSALVGVLMAACLTVTFRHRDLRRRIGVPMAIAGVATVLQAVLGGLLVETGTSTHWLFLHQGDASLIMGCIVIALLRLLQSDADAERSAAAGGPPGLRLAPVRRLSTLALGLAWVQLILGALVAGSRHGAAFHEWAIGDLPYLIDPHAGLIGNIQDNAWLHQWLHRWTAWLLVAVVLVLALLVHLARRQLPRRVRLSVQVAVTFLLIQAMLGVANVIDGIQPLLSLAHQFMGMCLLLSLVLAWYDIRHELPDPPVRLASPAPRTDRSRVGRAGHPHAAPEALV